MVKILINCFVVLLPWCIRRRILNTFYHYGISPTAKIGFSYIFPKHLIMNDGAKIGHLNVAVHLDMLQMGRKASIARGNWITGFPTGTSSKHFAHQKDRKSELIIGNESAITKNHHIDCTNRIAIGDYVTLAGYRSQLLTHSIDVSEGRQSSHPISIGDYSFVSTGVILLGGCKLPAYSVLAAGSVLTKSFHDEYVLYGGVPAKPIKNLSHEAAYFLRKEGYVI
jgi:acetyltransferase-like isoleucine patch superfamily enzyme